MVKYLLIIVAFLIFVNGYSQSSDTFEGETVNVRDAENKKQGAWVKLNKAGKLEEKGGYIDNKKEGMWIFTIFLMTVLLQISR